MKEFSNSKIWNFWQLENSVKKLFIQFYCNLTEFFVKVLNVYSMLEFDEILKEFSNSKIRNFSQIFVKWMFMRFLSIWRNFEKLTSFSSLGLNSAKARLVLGLAIFLRFFTDVVRYPWRLHFKKSGFEVHLMHDLYQCFSIFEQF